MGDLGTVTLCALLVTLRSKRGCCLLLRASMDTKNQRSPAGFLQRIEDRMKKKTLALASIRIPEGCYEKNLQMLQKH